MPFYQQFTNGTRTIISAVHELTHAHMKLNGFAPLGERIEAQDWIEAKALFAGPTALTQQQLLLAALPDERKRIEFVRREYDCWSPARKIADGEYTK